MNGKYHGLGVLKFEIREEGEQIRVIYKGGF